MRTGVERRSWHPLKEVTHAHGKQKEAGLDTRSAAVVLYPERAQESTDLHT